MFVFIVVFTFILMAALLQVLPLRWFQALIKLTPAWFVVDLERSAGSAAGFCQDLGAMHQVLLESYEDGVAS